MTTMFLFTGENSFELRQRVQHWLHEFRAKHGEENLTRHDARIAFRTLLDEVAAAPFIAQKRLVLVEGIPKCTREEIEQLPRVQHEQVVLVFVEPKLDKRLAATKTLLQLAQCEEFPLRTGTALTAWLQDYAAAQAVQLPDDTARYLIDSLGNNQDLLAREVEKLSLYATGRPVQCADAQLLLACTGEQQVWSIMDLLAQGDTAAALQFVRRLLEQGESPHGLWNIMLWMLSSLVAVASAVHDGITSPAAISKQLGVSFGSARSLLPLARKLDPDALQALLDRVVHYDVHLKTGGHRASGEEPQELLAIIDRTLMACGA